MTQFNIIGENYSEQKQNSWKSLDFEKVIDNLTGYFAKTSVTLLAIQTRLRKVDSKNLGKDPKSRHLKNEAIFASEMIILTCKRMLGRQNQVIELN